MIKKQWTRAGKVIPTDLPLEFGGLENPAVPRNLAVGQGDRGLSLERRYEWA